MSSDGLLDTSVLIARERGRPLGKLPDRSAISVVTVAELHLGVLIAGSDSLRAQRLRTLASVERAFDALPIDVTVARKFAELVAGAKRARKRPKILDTLIAATALSHDLTVFTQDADFGEIADVEVVRV